MNKKCFIICPIGEEGSKTRDDSNTVYDYLLTPVCKKLNYEIIRCDKISSADKIDSEIIGLLNTAELVIADLTGLNPNVFYEIGYRKAIGLPCVHIALEGTNLPFDVSTVRTQFYSISNIAKSEEFKDNLENVIQNIEKKDSVIFKQNIPTKKILSTDKYIDIGFNVYYSHNSIPDRFRQKKTLIEVFKKIGLILIEPHTRKEIEEVMCTSATFDYLRSQSVKKPINSFPELIIFEESMSEILLQLLTLNYIEVNSKLSPSTYILTELGRSVLIQLREE